MTHFDLGLPYAMIMVNFAGYGEVGLGEVFSLDIMVRHFCGTSHVKG